MSPRDLRALLPHREPMLLLDDVTELVAGQMARGRWAPSGQEPFFAAHFPGDLIVPGVLMVEALAQLGGVLAATLDEAVGVSGRITGDGSGGVSGRGAGGGTLGGTEALPSAAVSPERAEGGTPGRALLLGIDRARFRRVVRPGEVLDLSVTLLQHREGACRLEGKVHVQGTVAAEVGLLLGRS